MTPLRIAAATVLLVGLGCAGTPTEPPTEDAPMADRPTRPTPTEPASADRPSAPADRPSATDRPTRPTAGTSAGASTVNTGPGTIGETYVIWLRDHGRPTEPVQAGTPMGAATSDYTFLFVGGAPGVKGSPAAIDPNGAVVAAGEPAGWDEFLAAPVPVATLHEQVAWLYGAWTTVDPDKPSGASVVKKHPSASGVLAPPLVEELSDGARFQAWFAEPPAFIPFRLTITATEGGTTFERTKLSELAP